MYRRSFIRSTASATAALAGFSGITHSASESSFTDEFGYAVVDFFDDGWDESALKDAVGETVDFVCYAYGMLDDSDEVEASHDPGFLSRFQQVALEDLQNNPDVYDWLLEYLDDISEFLDWLDVFPDWIATKVSDLAEGAGNLTKFVPLIASVKGLLNTGCGIHEQLESGDDPSPSRYVEFFKYVALTVVEFVLLITALGASYRVAFSVTGWVNRRLINVVGRSIGWRAYSWVLSQIHWGVRVAFAEGMDQTIGQTVGTVSKRIVSASKASKNPVSESWATKQARTDVKQMAEYTDKWGADYELWETQQWYDHQLEAVMQNADRLRRQVESFFGNLSL